MNVNGTVTNYWYDANDRLYQEQTGNAVTVYGYDRNGNQVLKNISGVVANYTYCSYDKLLNSGSTYYSYRPDELRLLKLNGNDVTYYIWDNDRLIAELSWGNSIKSMYYYGINLVKSENYGYYLYNAHGDVVQLTNSSGTVTKNYYYDAFGNEKEIGQYLDSGNATVENNPFRYAGEYFDKETGNYYLRARYYDPQIGRFTSQDSWKYAKDNDPLSLNLYTYCANSPVRYVDPSGHFAITFTTVTVLLIIEIVTVVGFGIIDSYNKSSKSSTIKGGDSLTAFPSSPTFGSKSNPIITPNVKAKEKDKVAINSLPKLDDNTIIYRSGSDTYYNLTPKESDLYDAYGIPGLSFSLIPPPKGNYVSTTIGEINKTGVLRAVVDKPLINVNHVSVFPINIGELKNWANTKETANENPHIYSILLKNIVVRGKIK